MRIVSVLFWVILSNYADRVFTQTCNATYPYSRCSSNLDCGCLPLTRSGNGGICAYLNVPCTDLIPCENDNRTCTEVRQVCVKHSRCQNIPLCYPLDMIHPNLCPPTTFRPSSSGSNNDLCETTTWQQQGITILGTNSTQPIWDPYDDDEFFVDVDETIYIVDNRNDQVIKWKNWNSPGEIVAGNGSYGSANNQLGSPNSIAIKKDGTIFVCDAGNYRVQRWYKNAQQGQTIIDNIYCTSLALDQEESLYIGSPGLIIKWPGNQIVAGGNDVGTKLNQLGYFPRIFIDQNQSIFVADEGNRVVKWTIGAREGIVVAGNNKAGNDSNQLNGPRSVFVDQMENVYIADTKNQRVVRWLKGLSSGTVIVDLKITDQYFDPISFSFGRNGNLFVLDEYIARVQMFTIDKNTCAHG
ncbi:unnamed protein product [Rotaria sordida]|uniref:NHL repeat containing protein n=1 Tax=Rotaria sordida TaxID=392033 RepID=A0A818Y1S4_9BILA|nr:unnamed protein product [Rotaria sordida]CAF3747341.1 unnamed protein product [Rotaria sordida]